MITIELMGGLGNQLFQIATLISYSLTHKIPFYFEKKEPTRFDRPFYWDNLLKSLSPFLKPPLQLPLYKEHHFHYKEIPYIYIHLLNYSVISSRISILKTMKKPYFVS